jgi:hypothetical protein
MNSDWGDFSCCWKDIEVWNNVKRLELWWQSFDPKNSHLRPQEIFERFYTPSLLSDTFPWNGTYKSTTPIFPPRKYQNRWQIKCWSNPDHTFLSSMGYVMCGLLLSNLTRSSSLRCFSFSTIFCLVNDLPYHHLSKLWLQFFVPTSILSIKLYSNKFPQFSLESYKTATSFTPLLTILSCSKNELQYVCSFVRSLSHIKHQFVSREFMEQ